jgi:hypothetical protein
VLAIRNGSCLSNMATQLLKHALSGYIPGDAVSQPAWKKHKISATYRADIVSPCDRVNHKSYMALLRLTFDNQTRYGSFEGLRNDIAIASGHDDELLIPDCQVRRGVYMLLRSGAQRMRCGMVER